MGTVALFLGAFVLALAGLSKFYMYDQLAVVPPNTTSTTISSTAPGADAEYLDAAAGLKVVTGPLQDTKVVTGNIAAGKEASKELDRNVVVWDVYNCTDKPDFNCGGGETPLSASSDRVAFDTHTGEVVPWNGSKSSSGGKDISPSDIRGLWLKFPFDTQKKSYQVWDSTVHKAIIAKYVGEGKIKGMKVYNFVQTIAPISTGTIDVPGSLVGSDKATVTADQVYSAVTNYSVEPVTGAILTGGSAVDSYLELDGQRALTTTKATLNLSDNDTTKLVNDYKSKAMLLSLVNSTVPIGGTILGLVLIGLGLFTRRGGNTGSPRTIDQGELVGSR